MPFDPDQPFEVVETPTPTATPVTHYSLGTRVGGPDPYNDGTPNKPGTNQGYGATGSALLTPGIVAVDPSIYPIGSILKDADSGEAFLAADRHGNKDPNVVDIFQSPDKYQDTKTTRNFVVVGHTKDIPKDAAGVKELLSSYGKVPDGVSALDFLAQKKNGFDPNSDFEVVNKPAPKFDPDADFETVQPSATPEIITTPIKSGTPPISMDMRPREFPGGAINLPARPSTVPAGQPSAVVAAPTAAPQAQSEPPVELKRGVPQPVQAQPTVLPDNNDPSIAQAKDLQASGALPAGAGEHATPNPDLLGQVDAGVYGASKGSAMLAGGLAAAGAAEVPNAIISAWTGPFAPLTFGVLNAGEFLVGGYLSGKGHDLVTGGAKMLAPDQGQGLEQNLQNHPTVEAVGEMIPMAGQGVQSVRNLVTIAKAQPTLQAAAKQVAMRMTGGAVAGAGMEPARYAMDTVTHNAEAAITGQPAAAVQPITVDSVAESMAWGAVLSGLHKPGISREEVQGIVGEAPTEILKQAAADPQFRKTWQYDSTWIDQELGRREGKESNLPPTGDPTVDAAKQKITQMADADYMPKPLEPEVITSPADLNRPVDAGTKPSDIEKEIPLGVDRPALVDKSLEVLNDQELELARRTAWKRTNELEKQWDEGELTPDQRAELAKNHDALVSATLERERRSAKDTGTGDLFYELNEAVSKFYPTEDNLSRIPHENGEKIRILLTELAKRNDFATEGHKGYEFLHPELARNPDYQEVQAGKMQDIKKWAEHFGITAENPEGNPREVTPTVEAPKVEQPATEPTAPTAAPQAQEPAPQRRTGVAQRTYEAAGLDVKPGEGVNAEQMYDRGKALIKAGADPYEVVKKIEEGTAITPDEGAIIHVYRDQLARESARTQDAVEADPENPQLQQAANDASNKELEFVYAIKPAATDWHKFGITMQGDADIDTGSFTAVKRAISEVTKKPVTPEQVKKAKDVSTTISDYEKKIEDLKKKLEEAVKNPEGTRPPKGDRSLRIWSGNLARGARARIAKRRAEGRLMTGLDPEDLADHVIIGTDYIVQGAHEFTAWSSKMIKEFGDYIKPQLKDIFEASKAKADEAVAGRSAKAEQNAVWQHAKDHYIDKGNDFNETVTKTASDLGMTVDQVVKAIAGPKGKRLSDEMYGTMAKRRQAVSNANAWIRSAGMAPVDRILRKITGLPFGIMTLGHAVGIETHAGSQAFRPTGIANWLRGFGNQWKFLLNAKGHEKMMQAMENDPDFNFWKRAGLSIDPRKVYDPYQEYSKWLGGRAGAAGSRAMDALKVFRLAQAKKYWQMVPDNLKTPENVGEAAKAMSEMVNRGSGEGNYIGGETNRWLFAAKLEASRWARIVGDPVRAGHTYMTWKYRTPVERYMANQTVKRAATWTAVYLSTLAVNQAILSLTKSKQKINFDDATRSDWLQHKGFGYRASFEGKVLAPLKLMAGIIETATGPDKKYGKNKQDRMWDQGLWYAKGKLSPLITTSVELASGYNFGGQPAPWSKDPGNAKHPRMKWWEFVGEHSPIPAAEATRTYAETLKEHGVPNAKIHALIDALWSGIGGAAGIPVHKDESEQ